MSVEVDAVAQSVLYEGYMLYPYSRSALKNQQRWTFGGVYPRCYCETSGCGEAWLMQTQCLVRGDVDSSLNVTVRFLQVVGLDGREDALERTYSLETALSAPASSVDLAIHQGQDVQRRTWRDLVGQIRAETEAVEDGLWRLTVRITNTTQCAPAAWSEALHHAFVSTHTILRVGGGELVSLLEPPQELASAAATCANIGTWPVLVGLPGERHTMLSSPIILYDYPRVSSETVGDSNDATEIDELLRLSILALTDDEKDGMRRAGPRTRAILEQTEAMGQEQLLNLHADMRQQRHP